MHTIEKFADMIKSCDRIVFFGGAGVSTESGVKDYRSEDGLFHTVKEYGVAPETILSRGFFLENPEVFYDFYRKYFICDAKPNAAHKALADLEKMGKLRAVITQNIDNLHQEAGCSEVIELHGNTREFYCDKCGKEENTEKILSVILDGKVPRCACCGGVVRPRVVLYGEMLHANVPERAVAYIESADMLIVGGTSLMVNPAATLIRYFRGKYFVIINKEETDCDCNAQLLIRDPIGEVFQNTMQYIKQ